MILIGIILGIAGGLLQIHLLRRMVLARQLTRMPWRVWLTRFLLYGALLIGAALISIKTLISLVVTLSVLLIGYQITLYFQIRKDDRR